uniref:Uncharacterized protein n=1 Tax=Anopheles albimanus TaxID=7167 RepID=A0A182FX65_ANOAL
MVVAYDDDDGGSVTADDDGGNDGDGPVGGSAVLDGVVSGGNLLAAHGRRRPSLSPQAQPSTPAPLVALSSSVTNHSFPHHHHRKAFRRKAEAGAPGATVQQRRMVSVQLEASLPTDSQPPLVSASVCEPAFIVLSDINLAVAATITIGAAATTIAVCSIIIDRISASIFGMCHRIHGAASCSRTAGAMAPSRPSA